MMIGPILRKTRSLFRLPGFTILWLVPLWFLLGLSKAVIFVVPFRRVAPALGGLAGVAPQSVLVSHAQERRALQIGRAIRLTARYTPWESNCFPQAIAARLLLGLYGIPYLLFLGVQRDDATSELKAHAWVTAGRTAVTGGFSFTAYTVVGVFQSRHLDEARPASSVSMREAR